MPRIQISSRSSCHSLRCCTYSLNVGEVALGLIAVISIQSFQKRLHLSDADFRDLIKKYGGRKREWICSASGPTYPTNGKNKACPKVIGYGTDSNKSEACNKAVKDAQDKVQCGCKAKHLNKISSQITIKL